MSKVNLPSDPNSISNPISNQPELALQAIQASNDGIAILDAQQRYLYVNDAYLHLYGYQQASHLLGLSWQMLYGETEMNRLEAVVMPLFWHQGHWRGEAIGRKQDGRAFYQELSLTALPQGGLICVVQDISNRKQIEVSLRRSRERYRSLVAKLPGVVYRCDSDDDRCMEFVSEAITALSGYPARDFLDNRVRAWPQLIHPDDGERVRVGVRDAIATHQPFTLEYRIIHADGSHRWCQEKGQANFDEVGNFLWVDGIILDITALKQAENSLQQQQAVLRAVIDTVPNMIFVKDENGRYLLANQAMADFYQVNLALLESHADADFHPDPQMVAKFHAENHQVLATGEDMFIPEEAVTLPEIGKAWLQWQKRRIQLPGSQTYSVLGVGVNITARKQLEEDLRQSQKFLDSIIENAPFCVFTKDVQNEFRYTLINKNCEDLLGFSREDAIGKNDYELLPKKQADFHHAEDCAALALGKPLEIPEVFLERPNGVNIWGRSYKLPLYDSEGNPSQILGIAEDITARKHQDEALKLMVEGTAAKTGSAFFRTCVQYLAQALRVRYALITEYTDQTHTRLRTLALWADNTIGYNTEIDVSDLPCAPTATDSICFYPNNFSHQFPGYRHLFAQGAESYLSMRLVNGVGEPLGYLAVLDTQPMARDAGREMILRIFAARAGAELERQQAEHALQQAKEQAEAASRAKSAFLANMSHELRTPLNAILGFAQLMERSDNLSTQQRTFLDTINRSGAHLRDLINDILEMSTIETGRVALTSSVFDLHQLLSSLRDIFQPEAIAKNLDLTFTLSTDLPQYIQTDHYKLRQILNNLLSNALKFTEQGAVSLHASTVTHATPVPTCTLYFEITDTGCGITPETGQLLFKPFIQTTRSAQCGGGTGLGLVISRQYAQLMGGKLHYASIPNQGTTFYVKVQVQLAEPSELALSPLPARVLRLAPGQPDYRILIADPQADNRSRLTQMLATAGFPVFAVANGPDILAQYQVWQPHLIWIDKQLPDIDSLEVIRRIRTLGYLPAPVIIALINDLSASEQTAFLAAGCDDFAQKPLSEMVIFNLLAVHLNLEYLYEDQRRPPLLQTITRPPLFVQELESMTDDWVRSLHQAAIAVDSQEIQRLIQLIPAASQTLANKLTHLTQCFSFDDILEATASRLDL